MEKKLKKFPTLKDDILFYLHPNNKIIISSTDSYHFKRITYDGWQIFKNCNGLKNIYEIKKELSKDWDVEISEIITFLLDAEKRGYIYFNDNPDEKNIRIIGDGKMYYPQTISLELTNKCNLNCLYCYGSYGPSNFNFLNSNKILWLFNLLKNNGVTTIELTGGEPLIHPDIRNILRLAFDYFNYVVLISNGVLFSRELFDIIGENKKKFYAQISLDGSNEKINAKIRQKNNTFNKTITTIKTLVEMGLYLRVSYMLTMENKDDLRHTCNLMRDIGVKRFAISIPESLGRGVNMKFPDGKIFKDKTSSYYYELYKLIKEINEDFSDIIVNVKRIKEINNYDEFITNNCGAGWKAAVMDPTGDIRACILLDTQVAKLGNIFKDDYLSIFNNNSLCKLYQCFDKSEDEPDCKNCKYNFFCAQCITKIYIANKHRISINEDFCPIAKKIEMDKLFNFQYDLIYNI